MTARPCIKCGDLIATGSRCRDCQRSTSRQQPRRRPEHHLNGARWKNLSAKLRRQQPFCLDCGSTDDLTVDHIVRAADRPDWIYEVANLAVRCRHCNSARARTPATEQEVREVEERITQRKRRRRRIR